MNNSELKRLSHKYKAESFVQELSSKKRNDLSSKISLFLAVIFFVFLLLYKEKPADFSISYFLGYLILYSGLIFFVSMLIFGLFFEYFSFSFLEKTQKKQIINFLLKKIREKETLQKEEMNKFKEEHLGPVLNEKENSFYREKEQLLTLLKSDENFLCWLQKVI